MTKIIAGTLLILWGTVIAAFVCFGGEGNQADIVRLGKGALMGASLIYLGVCVLSGISPIGLLSSISRLLTGKTIESLTFPRWSAPIVGAGAVGAIGFASNGGHPDPFSSWEMIAGGAALGFLAGCLIWALEPSPSSEANCSSEMIWLPDGHHLATQASVDQSLLGRVAAVLAILVCWAPIIGTAMGLAAVLANQKSSGWPRKLGWIATGVSLGWVLLIAATSLLALFV